MKRFQKLSLALLFLAISTGPAFCGDKPTPLAEKPANQSHIPFLGLMVEDVHPAIASQLPDSVPIEQGVLVAEVRKDSPAAHAGLKVHDILMTYDDQKLFNPDQLFKLIRTDKPGREVTISLVRKGKTESLKIKLGEQPVSTEGRVGPSGGPQRPPRFPWFHAPHAEHPGLFSRPERPKWDAFDSLTLKRLDGDRFHASVQHTDKQGKLQKHEYEGTRDEIHKKIEDDKDLSPDARSHLLRSLDIYTVDAHIWLTPDESGVDF